MPVATFTCPHCGREFPPQWRERHAGMCPRDPAVIVRVRAFLAPVRDDFGKDRSDDSGLGKNVVPLAHRALHEAPSSTLRNGLPQVLGQLIHSPLRVKPCWKCHVQFPTLHFVARQTSNDSAPYGLHQ